MIGALRHKLELLSFTRVADDAGGAEIAWLPGPEIWAKVERLTSTRDIVGDRARRLKRIAASIRYRSDILLGQQVRFDGEAYEVVSIESGDDKDRQLTLICEEVPS